MREYASAYGSMRVYAGVCKCITGRRPPSVLCVVGAAAPDRGIVPAQPHPRRAITAPARGRGVESGKGCAVLVWLRPPRRAPGPGLPRHARRGEGTRRRPAVGPEILFGCVLPAGSGRKRPGPAILRAPGIEDARPGAQGYGKRWIRCLCGLPRGAPIPPIGGSVRFLGQIPPPIGIGKETT